MKKDEGKNIIICGLGGQGVVLLGKILTDFYDKEGYNLKISNVMGLGQRGGDVQCHLRYSTQAIMSPIIKYGDADYIISFEQSETLRNLHYLNDQGTIISSKFELSSPTVNIGIQKDIQGNKIEIMKDNAPHVYIIDTEKYVNSEINLSKVINVILLAFFARLMKYDDDKLLDALKRNVNAKYIKDNIKGYEFGKKIFKDYCKDVD